MGIPIKHHIPNLVTCCNLFSGCIAAVMAFQANYQAAILFIIIGAVFDFFDGDALVRAVRGDAVGTLVCDGGR